MTKQMDVTGKVAIITGGARGLGRGISESLAAEGIHVVIADVVSTVEGDFQDVRKKFPANNGFGIRVDVTKVGEIETMVETTIKKFGRIDILVNNAGICSPEPQIVDSNEELLDRVMDVNFKGAIRCSQKVAKHMIHQGSGTIVNMSSWCGKIAFAGLGWYNASKAAVRSLTQTLALELAKYNITVNCLCPGDAATDMHWKFVEKDAKERGITFEEMKQIELKGIPLGRYGLGEDFAGAILWLASKFGAYVTGQAINIDGGKNYFC
jgi:NAD(P)-dependent dehydrogenase (short-subunit alcohol dehydrogenase family)